MAERESGRERGGIDLRSLSKAYITPPAVRGLSVEREPSQASRPRGAICKNITAMSVTA